MSDAPMIDASHDLARQSWVESANTDDTHFPIQNLPWCSFTPKSGEPMRLGIGIGDQVLDIARVADAGALDALTPETRCALAATNLNDLMRHSPSVWRTVRLHIADLLDASASPHPDWLHSQDSVTFDVPATIGDYTDFYCAIHHATNVGSMFRPDNPLLPNYKHLPIGYHGRASSIVVSGTPVVRPHGQTVPADGPPPNFGPIRLMDYEMEMGAYVGGHNPLGKRVAIGEAGNHLFGMSIVNDWSARDVQKWEYQPLGPFNAKNFCTSVSPFVVTMDALAPFREAGPTNRGDDDPEVLDYLKPAGDWQINIDVIVELSSRAMRDAGTKPMQVSRGNFRDMYWTVAQMLVHHASTGCNVQAGDLIASGTISGPTEDSRGCLLERTWRGTQPLSLPDGTERKFLQDGDEVTMLARCDAAGRRSIGFGTCAGVIAPSA